MKQPLGVTIERWMWEEVHTQVRRLAALAKYLTKGRQIALYGVPRGGLVFGCMLAHELGAEGKHAIQSTGQYVFRPPGAEVAVVVDDVCETGATFKELRERLAATLGMPVLTLAAVIKEDVELDVEGFGVQRPTSVWVRFPWEHESVDAPEVDCFGVVGEDEEPA